METFWSRVRMFDRWSRSRISPLSKTITNERATKRLSDHWTHNYRRTYNDCFKSAQKRQNLERRNKMVLALSWRDVTITAMQTAFVSPLWIRNKTQKRFHIPFFHIFCIGVLVIELLRGLAAEFGRNIQLLLPTVTWAFLAEIVNGQNYSIVATLQILVG